MRHLSDIEENKFRIGASSRNSSKFISERITHDVKFVDISIHLLNHYQDRVKIVLFGICFLLFLIDVSAG